MLDKTQRGLRSMLYRFSLQPGRLTHCCVPHLLLLLRKHLLLGAHMCHSMGIWPSWRHTRGHHDLGIGTRYTHVSEMRRHATLLGSGLAGLMSHLRRHRVALGYVLGLHAGMRGEGRIHAGHHPALGTIHGAWIIVGIFALYRIRSKGCRGKCRGRDGGRCRGTGDLRLAQRNAMQPKTSARPSGDQIVTIWQESACRLSKRR